MTVRERLAGWIDFWSSREATIVPLLLALGAQLPHSAVVYHRVSTTFLSSVWNANGMGNVIDWLGAIVAAIAVEVAVLVFVLKGKIGLSWFFAAASFAMNLIYYWQAQYGVGEDKADMFGALLWAALLPAAIAFYSHEVGDKKNEDRVVWWRRLIGWLVPHKTVVVTPGESKTAVKPAKHASADLDAFAGVFTESVNGALVGKPKPKATRSVASNGISNVDRVAQLAAEQLSTKQIAEMLGISESTVRVYRMQAKKSQGVI